jgi:hypothetical protein
MLSKMAKRGLLRTTGSRATTMNSCRSKHIQEPKRWKAKTMIPTNLNKWFENQANKTLILINKTKWLAPNNRSQEDNLATN